MYKSSTSKNKLMKIKRIELDLSQKDLARLVGVTRQTIGMIETGNYNPSLKLCQKIARELNCTLDCLFGENEEG